MTLFLLIVPLFTFVIFLSSAAYYKLLDSQAMMSFYKKLAPHSLLGLTATTTTTPAAPSPSTANENLHHYIPSSLTGGLFGLVTDVTQRHPAALVLESSTMKQKHSSSSSLSLPPFLPPPATNRVVPGRGGGNIVGGLRFLDDVSGGVDGFVSCTESLGFESSDEIMRVDDQAEEVGQEVRLMRQQAENGKRAKWRKTGADKRTPMDKEGKKKFPPPISSLNQNGQPSFYLRPVRKDGRLELTEVRLHRPEILRAYRGDGRLRLHLISHDEEEDEEDHDEMIEEEEIVVVEEERVDVREEIEKVEVEASVISEDQWTMGVAGGEGFRRCQDNVHHHHNHHVWNNQQHCVV